MTKFEKLKKTVENDLLTYPRDNLNFARKALRFIRYPRRKGIDSFFWPHTMLAIGLMHDVQMNKAVRIYCDRFINKGCPIRYLDNTMIGIPLLYLYKNTHEEKYLNAAIKLVSYLMNHPTNKHKSLFYREGFDQVLLDAIGMICPFLSEYAAMKTRKDIAIVAEIQIKNFIEYAMDNETGLPYHGYNQINKIGIIGWGRGVGWLLIGMVGYLEYCNNETINHAYRTLVDTTLKYQNANGMFHWQLQAKDGPVDTSATSMILNGIYDGIKCRLLPREYMTHIKQGLDSLNTYITVEGNVIDCSAECCGVSMYPQKYSAYPWSNGPTLSLNFKLDNSLMGQ